MHIVVCLKQVPDPEGPSEAFAISSDGMRVEPKGIPPVISTYDDNALEVALRVKDANSASIKLTVLTLGLRISNAVMIKALAAGADDVIKVEDEIFETGRLDSMGTAVAVAAAIRKVGDVDVVFFGRQSADLNAGVTGIGVAKYLGIPVVTAALTLGFDNQDLVITRDSADGHEKVKITYPAVVVVGSEVGELRYPTMKQRQDAKKKPFTAWSSTDIGFDKNYSPKIILHGMAAVEMRQAQCEFIAGQSAEESGKLLAQRLREDKVL